MVIEEMFDNANSDMFAFYNFRKEKALRKIVEDTSCGIRVAVYRVKSLSNPSKKFKVPRVGCTIPFLI